MVFHKIILLSLLVAVASAAPAEPGSLDYILANLTSLWKEVSQLKREVNFHVHNGDMDHEHDLDKTLYENKVMAHEHHVHHLKHPHEGHNEHHNENLLGHLEMAHGHGGHGGHGSHGSHDRHGSPSGSHSGSHGGSHGYDSGEDDDSHEEDSSPNPGPSPPHRRGPDHGRHSEHGGHGGHDDSHEDDHSIHGLNLNALGHVSSDARDYEPNHYAPPSMGEGSAPRPFGVKMDAWQHASCHLLPNAAMPESRVIGRVDMSQKMAGRLDHRIVFFDIDVEGLDITKNGRLYTLHVHERPAQDQMCDAVGGFNRPSVAALADPSIFGDEHAGNLGGFLAEDDGEIDNKISASLDVTFDEVIGKAIVVHSESGERLACCNVFRVPAPRMS